MQKHLLALALFMCVHLAFAQSFNGIIYGDDDVVEGAVIQNITRGSYAITDREGIFEIRVDLEDSLKISAAFYTSQFIVINRKHLNENWVIELKENLNELDEVRIQDSIVEVEFDAVVETQKLQKVIQDDYAKNPSLYTPERITGGVDFIGLAIKLIKLLKSDEKKAEEARLPPSTFKDFAKLFEEDNIFNDALLTDDLAIPLEYKTLFFDYLDSQKIPSELRQEANYFELLDRLFTESENFKKLLETAKAESEKD